MQNGKVNGDDMADHDRLNEEVRAIWDQNADFWDQRMGEGNDFHKLLIEPTQLELLKITGGEIILEAACGNGQFARKMADLGASVIAVDASERMIENAKARSADYAGRIEYQICDCTDKNRLLALGERRLDRVVCTMALMDMAEIEPLNRNGGPCGAWDEGTQSLHPDFHHPGTPQNRLTGIGLIRMATSGNSIPAQANGRRSLAINRIGRNRYPSWHA